jgi:hypothetical protein
MTRAEPLSRRTVLRGLGTALALPFLEATLARGALAKEARPPTRAAFLFVPNGVDVSNWRPADEGPLATLPSVLAPLDVVKDDVLVLSGLTLDKARANGDGPGDHARSAAAFLTASQPLKTAGADLAVGTSVDQVLAARLGRETALASLELGCEPARQSGSCDSGYSCAYSSSIAWASPSTPLGKEVSPRAAFDRLVAFGDERASEKARAARRLRRRSVLDFVREDARRLRVRLGAPDRRKLDEYLEAVRRLERRIEGAASLEAGDLEERLGEGVPRDLRDHIALLSEILVLAFRSDRTRVATFMLANAGSNRPYPFVGVEGGHHELSHHGGDEAKLRRIRAINRFHVAQLSRLIQAMKDVPEGDGTLLDHVILVYGSGIADGNRHDHHDLPIVVAGRGGGALRPGRHVRYPKETPLANLYLSVLDAMGAPQPTFGDATGRLPDLV